MRSLPGVRRPGTRSTAGCVRPALQERQEPLMEVGASLPLGRVLTVVARACSRIRRRGPDHG